MRDTSAGACRCYARTLGLFRDAAGPAARDDADAASYRHILDTSEEER